MMRVVAGHMSNKYDYQMIYRFSIRHGVKVPVYLQPKKIPTQDLCGYK